MFDKLIEQGPATAFLFAIIYFLYQHGPGLVESLKKTHKVLRGNQRAILKTQLEILKTQREFLGSLDQHGKRQEKHGVAIHHVANSVEAVVDGKPKDEVAQHIQAARDQLTEEHGRS